VEKNKKISRKDAKAQRKEKTWRLCGFSGAGVRKKHDIHYPGCMRGIFFLKKDSTSQTPTPTINLHGE